MKKRIWSLVLALALTMGLAGTVWGRETAFFAEKPHGTVDYADLTYTPLDLALIRENADALRTLAQDTAYLATVQEGFGGMLSWWFEANTGMAVAYIQATQDTADPALAAASAEAENNLARFRDILYALVRDLAKSPCREALLAWIPPEDALRYLGYQGLSDTYLDLTDTETETVKAVQSGQEPGEAYLSLLKLRRALAAEEGYESFPAYAYAVLYGRAYTPETIADFREAVRREIVPLYRALGQRVQEELWRDFLRRPYTGEETLAALAPCWEAMSDELTAAYDFLETYHLYSAEPGETRASGAYTIRLPSLGAAYLFLTREGTVEDFYSLVHEFGHYNNYYWEYPTWQMGGKSIDLCEVHAQGMELLMTHFYPELFGQDAEAAALCLYLDKLESLLTGVMVDSFETAAYALEEPTVEELDALYGRLLGEFGLTSGAPNHAWAGVSHLFGNPCYYISYAISAAGAWRFWQTAQEDYFTGVDDYLRFTALGVGTDFAEAFAAIDYPFPATGEAVEALAAELRESLPLGRRFVDVPPEASFAEAVAFAYRNGLMVGKSADRFDPAGTLTRAEAVTVLWRLAGRPQGAENPFPDVPSETWYTQAVAWAAEYGVVLGYPDGLFRPEGKLTENQAALLLGRLVGEWVEEESATPPCTRAAFVEELYTLLREEDGGK